MQDVLQYISLQTRRRFDLYSFGLSSYEETNAGDSRASVGAGNATPHTHQFYQTRARAPAPIPTSQPPATATAAAAATDRPYRYVVDLGTDQFDIGEHYLPNVNSVMSPTMLTALLAGLVPQMRTNNRVDELSSVANLLLRMGGATNLQGLEPVVVRPTAEQISQATQIARLDREEDCAICQDTITPTQDCRKILHCGHWFHKDCIDPWFRQNVQCPICRYDIREYRTQQSIPTPDRRQSFPEEDYH